MDDSTKGYHLVDPSKNADLRKNGRDEYKIKSCRKCHAIAVNKSGRFFTSLYFRNFNVSKMVFLDESMNYTQDIDIPDEITDNEIEIN